MDAVPERGFGSEAEAVEWMDGVVGRLRERGNRYVYRMNGAHHWGGGCWYPGRHPRAFIDWARTCGLDIAEFRYPPAKRGKGRPSPSVTQYLREIGEIPAEASPEGPDPGGTASEFGDVVG
jgi:hypothetical protein